MVGAACQGLLIPYPPYHVWMDTHLGAHWDVILQLAQATTIGSMGLFSAIAISGCLLRQLDINWPRRRSLTTLLTGIIAACLFLIMVVPYSDFTWSTLGYGNLFQGVFSGIITAEILYFTSQWAHRQHTRFLGLTDVFQNSLRTTVICAITLAGVGGTGYLFSLVQNWVHGLVVLPHAFLASTTPMSALPFHLVLVAVNQMLWELGFNGGQVLLSILSSSSIDSASAHSVSLTFVNSFAHLGGAGATWGLIIAIFAKGKDPSLRKLAWLALLPAIMNVNEPLLLGIPLIFRPAWCLPFIGAPMINCLITHGVMVATGTYLVTGESLWSTPIFLSGYLLTNSWVGPVAQLLSIFANTLMYIPYVKREERHRQTVFRHQFDQSVSFLSEPESISESYLDRPDHHGDVARRLFEEFQRDLGTPCVYLTYQPVHDRQNKCVYLEALLRWTHAEYGNIPPAAILNIVEESNFIHTLGEWVIEQASKDMTAWKLAGYDALKVAVNVSPIQLDSDQLPHVVEDVLQRYELAVSNLGFEITESRSLPNSRTAEKSLRKLQQIGIALSMDDFGMGYTSLLYMQRFNLFAIKLDGSLTRDIQHNLLNQDIIRTITRLGRSRHVKIVAEYVEDAEQYELLRTLGCDLFQGYLYSPAICSEELLNYLNRTQTSRE